jgi:hypothetical protein
LLVQVTAPFDFIDAGGDHGDPMTIPPFDVTAVISLIVVPAQAEFTVAQDPASPGFPELASGISTRRMLIPRSPDPVPKKNVWLAEDIEAEAKAFDPPKPCMVWLVEVQFIVVFGVIVYVPDATPLLVYPDSVAIAFTVLVVDITNEDEYVVPWEQVPAVVAVGVEPSVV